MVKYFILILCLLAMPIIGFAQHGVGTLVNFQCGLGLKAYYGLEPE